MTEDMCNFHDIPGGKVRLQGGMLADVSWDDSLSEGEIVYPEPEFADWLHKHTRDDAEDKARSLAPHIAHWIHTF